VAIWSANCAEWLIAHHGAVRIGAVVVTVNPALRQGEAEYILGNSEATVIIAARNFRTYSFVDALAGMKGNLPHLKQLIYFGDQPAEAALNWPGLSCPGEPCRAQAGRGAGVDGILRPTLRTSIYVRHDGASKGRASHHHGLLNNGFFVGERQCFTEKDRICLPVPFFSLLRPRARRPRGGYPRQCVGPSAEGFDTKSALASIAEERCTAFYGVPMMYIALLNDPDFDRYDLTSLRTGCMGAAPCPTETMRQAVGRMHMRESRWSTA